MFKKMGRHDLSNLSNLTPEPGNYVSFKLPPPRDVVVEFEHEHLGPVSVCFSPEARMMTLETETENYEVDIQKLGRELADRVHTCLEREKQDE